MLLSLCLFACTPSDPGTEDPENPEPSEQDQITRADFVNDNSTITLTDAETAEGAYEEAFNAAVSELSLNVRYTSGQPIRITGADCDYDLTNVTWGTFGVYYATVTPKTQGDVRNGNNITASAPLEIRIEHEFGEEDPDTHEATCSECGATRTTQTLEEDAYEGVTYGAFHNGVTNDVSHGDLTAITSFGNVQQSATVSSPVGTMTAGRIRKGMSITVTGTALAEPDDEEQWYFPNIGIALRDFDATTSPFTTVTNGYNGGMSVIVRNDAFVLMNGIGNTGEAVFGSRLLAGLVGSSTEDYNYGSHPEANAADYDNTPSSWNYNPGNMPTDSSQWGDWAVYSSGDIMRTGAYTETAREIRLTWTFRPDNVIELVYENITNEATLIARIKVPDEYADMQFDTVLHGDKVNMTFTSVSTIEQEKLNDVQFTGYEGDETMYYAANQAFNFADLVGKVRIDYTQSVGQWVATEDYELQVYRGEATEAQPPEDADGWTTVNEATLLRSTDRYFRVMVAIGSVTKYAYMEVGGAENNFVSAIVANNVTDVYGFAFEHAGVMADSTALGNVGFGGNMDGQTAQVAITLTGSASRIPEEFESDLAGCTGYVALRIWGSDLGTAAAAAGGAPVVIVANTATYIDVIVGIGGAQTSATLTGAQDTPIVVDVSGMVAPLWTVDITGIAQGEQSDLTAVPLNTGADVTVQLILTDDMYNSAEIGFSTSRTTAVADLDETGNLRTDSSLRIAYKNCSAQQDPSSGLWTVTLTFEIPAIDGIDSNGYWALYFAESASATPVATNIYYGLPAASSADGFLVELDNGYTAYVTAEGTDIYYYVARTDHDLTAEDISSTLYLNVNGGSASEIAPTIIDLGFRYSNGAAVLADNALAQVIDFSYGVFGTTDNDRDYDTGFFFAGVVDATAYGVPADASEYYFQIGATTESMPGYKVTVATEGTTLAQEAAIANANVTLHTFVNGSCMEAGLYGYEYVVGDEVVFWANLFANGGDHHFAGGKCIYCGGTTVRENLNSGATTFDLEDGQYLEINDQYRGGYESSSPEVLNGLNMQITNQNGSGWWIRSDGFVGYADNVAIAYANKATNVTHSLDGEENNPDLRTPIGKLDPDGNEITEESYMAVVSGTITGGSNNELRGGYTRVYVAYEAGTITVTWKLFENTNNTIDYATATPYFEFTVSMQTTGDVSVLFRDDGIQFGNNASRTVNLIRGSVVNNKLTDELGTAGASIAIGDATFSHSTLTALDNGVVDGYAELALSGNATDFDASNATAQKNALGIPAAQHGDYDKYIALTVNFSEAVASADTVSVVTVNGANYARAAFNEARTAIDVVIACDDDLTAVELDFAFGGPYTLQAVGVRLDLAAVASYEVTSSVSSSATLNAGGNVVITYEGDVPATGVHFYVNGSELASGQTADGVAFVGYANSALTVTLPSFMAAAKSYVIEMRDANGALVNSVTVAATELDSTGGSVAVDEGTEIIVNGANATFIFTDNMIAGTTKSFYLNANAGGTDGLGWYDYTFSIAADGRTASFVYGADNATNDALAIYTVNGKTFVVMTLDLTARGVTAGSAYGFEYNESGVAAGEGENITYYTVSAAGALNPATAAVQNADTIVENSCEATGIEGISVSVGSAVVFYANVTIIPSHDWADPENDKVYVDEECGAIYTAEASGFATGALAGVTETGLTVSYLLTDNTNSEWTTTLATAQGNLLFASVCIDPWNANITGLDVSSIEGLSDRIALLQGANLYPSIAGGMESGFNSNAFLNTTSYITVVFTPANGVNVYQNGRLAISYEPTITIGQKGGTVNDYANAFLGLVQLFGVRVASATAEDAIIQPVALTAEQVETRYNNYVVEHNYYPVHEHSYSPTTDRCGCGELDPAHEHRNWTNGACGICGEACAHETFADEVCTVCGGRISDTTSENVVPATWNSTTQFLVIGSNSIVLTGQYADAGASEYQGLVVQVRTKTDEIMYFIRPSGDYASGSGLAWNTPYADTTMTAPGYVSDTAAYIAAKKTASTRITITLDETADTLTVVYDLLDAEGSATRTLTWTMGGMTDNCYHIGIGLDGASLTADAATVVSQTITFSDGE